MILNLLVKKHVYQLLHQVKDVFGIHIAKHINNNFILIVLILQILMINIIEMYVKHYHQIYH